MVVIPGIAVRDADSRGGYREPARSRGVRVVLSWRSRAIERRLLLPALFGALVLAATLLAAFTSALLGGSPVPALVAFLLIAPIAGLIAASPLVSLYARTEVCLDADRLWVEHHPAGWATAVELRVDAVEQLRVRRAQRAEQHESWLVEAVLYEGHAKVLVEELATAAHASTVCKLLTDHTQLRAAVPS